MATLRKTAPVVGSTSESTSLPCVGTQSLLPSALNVDKYGEPDRRTMRAGSNCKSATLSTRTSLLARQLTKTSPVLGDTETAYGWYFCRNASPESGATLMRLTVGSDVETSTTAT